MKQIINFENCTDYLLPKEDKKEVIQESKVFRDKPFYCYDIKKLHKDTCCFNHIVGLPLNESSRLPNPLFDYELKLFEAWQKHKHIWVLKATGLGITEFFLRLMMWLAVRNDDYKDAQFCIIVGPNIGLAKILIKRLKSMIEDILYREIETDTQISIEVNSVLIQAFPSNHLDAYRSLTRPKFIFIDEADFFEKGEQTNVRTVSERYIGKSQPWIVMVSTPNKPDELMQTIEREENSIYKKFKFNYEWGLNKIYDNKAIKEAMRSPAFEQEYNLKYLGKIGNTFDEEHIMACIELGKRYEGVPPTEKTIHLIGIDPGFSSSKTALYVGEFVDNIVRILEWESYDKETPSHIVDDCFDLYVKYGVDTRFIIDGSNAGFINELKSRFRESLDWSFKEVNPLNDKIVPINFGTEHKSMLEWMHYIISSHRLAIPEGCTQLITSLRTAQSVGWSLDKNHTVYDDDLDACRLMLTGIRRKNRFD